MKPFPFQIILNWYKKNGRHDLPWRQNQNAYRVWISEIFLQQTQVPRVREYYKKVTEKFPDIFVLAATDYETFFPYYQGLGYYSRARNMLKTAKIISEEYNGVFPDNLKELKNLPGIWSYTAQAILSFAYEQDILAFDTNIEKIFSRYYFWSRYIKLSKDQKNFLQQQFEKTKISGREINAAMMDFSSLIDVNTISGIDFQNYPLKNSEFFRQKGKNEIKPITLPKKNEQVNKKQARIIVFLHKDHKEYYSKNFDNFEPFELSPHDGDHRHYIQKYFLENYFLSLSVRPPFKKEKLPNGSAMYYNAQIQSGEHNFWIYKKEDIIPLELPLQ